MAIVPCYNESADAVYQTVRSLLSGSVAPDIVYVIDDGSHEPIPPIHHPRVRFLRQSNGGKREAQARTLYELRYWRDHGVPRADYILTVDSDCELDRHALRHLLRAMSDDRVQAATGLPLVRNRHKSVLAWLADLEIASICLTVRAARSRLGSLTTCSGALTLYRADVVLDNLDDYVKGGTLGDDHRLTHYAMLRGHVVSVSEAIVHTDMPTTIKGLYRQRLRWSSSHWEFSLWEIAHLPTEPMLWSAYNLIVSLIIPIGLVTTLVIIPVFGYGIPWAAMLYWVIATWLATMRYAFRRPGLPMWDRWLSWLVGVPMLLVVQIVIFQPAMLKALYRIIMRRESGWLTR